MTHGYSNDDEEELVVVTIIIIIISQVPLNHSKNHINVGYLIVDQIKRGLVKYELALALRNAPFNNKNNDDNDNNNNNNNNNYNNVRPSFMRDN